MKYVSIQKLSELTGLSKSTISRAIHHCGGVDAQTAARIHQLARELGYPPPKVDGISLGCGIVLPKNPAYFWSLPQKKLLSFFNDQKIPVRMALYPQLDELDAFCSALEAMESLQPRTLLVCAPSHPEAKQRLQALADRIPIFLLSECLNLVNAFYFGSNRKEDGRLLGRAFSAFYPHHRSILVIDGMHSSDRTDAFLYECPQCDIVSRLEVSQWRAYTPSILARRIASEVDRPFDCVYCGTGALPCVCLALEKLHTDPRVICIGYEKPPSKAGLVANGRVRLLLCQDIVGQTELCAQAVARFFRDQIYPESKNRFVSSVLLRMDRGGAFAEVKENFSSEWKQPLIQSDRAKA